VLIIFANFLYRHNFFSGLGKYKKIKVGAGGIELEHKDEGDTEKDKQQDSIINDIKTELEAIKNRLDIHYAFIRDAVVQSGIGVVWSGAKAPFKEIIWAGLNNIKLGENGNLIPRLVAVIMQQGDGGISLYHSELNKFIKDNFTKPKKEIPEHFREVVKEIEKHIY